MWKLIIVVAALVWPTISSANTSQAARVFFRNFKETQYSVSSIGRWEANGEDTAILEFSYSDGETSRPIVALLKDRWLRPNVDHRVSRLNCAIRDQAIAWWDPKQLVGLPALHVSEIPIDVVITFAPDGSAQLDKVISQVWTLQPPRLKRDYRDFMMAHPEAPPPAEWSSEMKELSTDGILIPRWEAVPVEDARGLIPLKKILAPPSGVIAEMVQGRAAIADDHRDPRPVTLFATQPGQIIFAKGEEVNPGAPGQSRPLSLFRTSAALLRFPHLASASVEMSNISRAAAGWREDLSRVHQLSPDRYLHSQALANGPLAVNAGPRESADVELNTGTIRVAPNAHILEPTELGFSQELLWVVRTSLFHAHEPRFPPNPLPIEQIVPNCGQRVIRISPAKEWIPPTGDPTAK
jgi:hypothetical protein